MGRHSLCPGQGTRSVSTEAWHSGCFKTSRASILQPGILFLQALEPLGLLYPQTAVFFTPAIVSLLGDANLPAGFGDGDTLVNVDLSFPQLVDSLLRSVGFSDYLSPLLVLFY